MHRLKEQHIQCNRLGKAHTMQQPEVKTSKLYLQRQREGRVSTEEIG